MGGDQASILFESGVLEVPRRSVAGIPAEDGVAVLTCTTVWLKEGASVVMPGTSWNTLRIEGKFWFDGEFRAAIARTTDTCDRIVATGKVVVGENKGLLTLRWDTNVQLMGARKWPVVESEGNDIFDLPKNNLQTLEGGANLFVDNNINDKIIHVQRIMD